MLLLLLLWLKIEHTCRRPYPSYIKSISFLLLCVMTHASLALNSMNDDLLMPSMPAVPVQSIDCNSSWYMFFYRIVFLSKRLKK